LLCHAIIYPTDFAIEDHADTDKVGPDKERSSLAGTFLLCGNAVIRVIQQA